MFCEVVGPTACGGTKPVVNLSADTCDVMERSGLVDPLFLLPADMRCLLGLRLAFCGPSWRLSRVSGHQDVDRAEYIRLVVKQLESGRVGLRHDVRAWGTVFWFWEEGFE